MNIRKISVGLSIALIFVFFLICLQIYFLVIQNMFLVFLGAMGLVYCCDTMTTALRCDGVITQ